MSLSVVAYNELISTIFEHSPYGIAAYVPTESGADDDFIFVEFNKTAESISNIKKDDLIGKKLTECFPNMRNAPLFSALKEVDKSGTTKKLEAFYYRDSCREGFITNTILKLNSGQIVAMYSDSTQEEISKRVLKATFDTDKNMICVLSNQKGKLLGCNSSLLSFFGYGSVDEFRSAHEYICELFEEDIENECIGEFVDGVGWIESGG